MCNFPLLNHRFSGVFNIAVIDDILTCELSLIWGSRGKARGHVGKIGRTLQVARHSLERIEDIVYLRVRSTIYRSPLVLSWIRPMARMHRDVKLLFWWHVDYGPLGLVSHFGHKIRLFPDHLQTFSGFPMIFLWFSHHFLVSSRFTTFTRRTWRSRSDSFTPSRRSCGSIAERPRTRALGRWKRPRVC